MELSRLSFGRQKHEAELKYPQRIRRLNIFPASKTEVLNQYKFLHFVISWLTDNGPDSSQTFCCRIYNQLTDLLWKSIYWMCSFI